MEWSNLIMIKACKREEINRFKSGSLERILSDSGYHNQIDQGDHCKENLN